MNHNDPIGKSLRAFGLLIAAALCVLAAIVFAVFVMTTPAAAQATTNCAPREVVVYRLTSKYTETRRAFGLVENGQMIEVFASAQTGSWTIMVTSPTGVSCLIASGQSFEAVNDPLPDQGKDL